MIWQQILEEPAVGEMLPDSIVGFVPVFDAVCYRAPGTIPSLELFRDCDVRSVRDCQHKSATQRRTLRQP